MGVDGGNLQVIDIEVILFKRKMLFLTFSVLVSNTKKITLHSGQPRSWSA